MESFIAALVLLLILNPIQSAITSQLSALGQTFQGVAAAGVAGWVWLPSDGHVTT